jgi:hypothetical protein
VSSVQNFPVDLDPVDFIAAVFGISRELAEIVRERATQVAEREGRGGFVARQTVLDQLRRLDGRIR